MIGFWKSRRAAQEKLADALQTSGVAQAQHERAKEALERVSTQEQEHRNFIQENHVRLKLRTTFRKGTQYGH